MKRRAKECPDCKHYAVSPMDWPCNRCIPAHHPEIEGGGRLMFEPKEGGIR